MKSSKFVAVLAAIAIVVLAGQPIFAQKAFLKKIKELYPDIKKEIANCSLCHTFDKEKKEHPTKKNLNLYGKDLQAAPEAKIALDQKDEDEHKFTDDELKAIEAAIKAIAGKDSNGNGKTNEEDIKAGVNPGVK